MIGLRNTMTLLQTREKMPSIASKKAFLNWWIIVFVPEQWKI